MRSGSVPQDGAGRRIPQERPPIPLLLLVVVFALEGVGLLAVLVLLIVETATSPGRSVDVASALAIVVLTAFGVLALGLLARNAWLRRSWTRSAGIVWQVVQLFVGLAAFQGAGANPVLGSVVAVPAVVGLVLLFTPSVRRALRRSDPPAPEPQRRPDTAPPRPSPRRRR